MASILIYVSYARARLIMTYSKDLDIAKRLINGDQEATRSFFQEECRGMLTLVIDKVFDYPVEYDELVNALYIHIMENDAYRLRQYAGRSSIYLWLRTTATRFFIQYRGQVIEDTSHEYPLIGTANELQDDSDENEDFDNRSVRRAFDRMSNRRYAYVLQRLVIDEASPQDVAAEMGVTVDNLYNIKKRAIAQLTIELTKFGIRKR